MEMISKILKDQREKKHLSIRDLSLGICSPGFYCRIESGKTSPNPLLLRLLIERLGISFNRLEIIIDKKSYDQLFKYAKLSLLLEQNDTDKARTLLSDIYKYSNNNPVNTMFRYRFLSWLAFSEGNYTEALAHIETAIRETIKPRKGHSLVISSISSTEIENVLFFLYIKFIILNEANKTDYRCTFILNLINEYVERVSLDDEEKAIILSKVMFIETHLAMKENESDNAIHLCTKALKLLIKERILFLMPFFLETILSHVQTEIQAGTRIYYQQYKRIIESAIKTSLCKPHNYNCLLSRCLRTIYHLDNEVIISERKRSRKTQAAFSFHAYAESSSLSRVETGKSSIRSKIFSTIMRQSNINNRFSLNSMHMTKDILDSKLLYFDKHYPIINDNVYRPPFWEEAMCISSICSNLINHREKAESIKICQRVFDSFALTKVSPIFHIRIYELLMDTLSECKAVKPTIIEKLSRLSLICGNLDIISFTYDTAHDE